MRRIVWCAAVAVAMGLAGCGAQNAEKPQPVTAGASQNQNQSQGQMAGTPDCIGAYPGVTGPNPCVMRDGNRVVVGGMVGEQPVAGTNPCAVRESESCKLFPSQ